MLKKFLDRQKQEIKIKGFKFIFVKIKRRIKNIIYSSILIAYVPVLILALIVLIVYMAHDKVITMLIIKRKN